MDWFQVLTILSVLLSAIGYLHSEIKSFKNEIRQDMIIQRDRTDRLYEMFIDLLKEKK
jgi:hypothetical protein